MLFLAGRRGKRVAREIASELLRAYVPLCGQGVGC
jgi:hypothetical protein